MKNNNINNNTMFNRFENVNAEFGWDTVGDKLLLVIKNSENKELFELELASDKEMRIAKVTKMKVFFKRYEEAKLK